MKKTGKSLLSVIISLAMVISTITCIMPSVFADGNYLITFDVPEGAWVYPETQYTDDNGKLETMPVAYLDGYTFMGWYLDGWQCFGNDSFEDDATLYAQFLERPAPLWNSFDFEGDLEEQGWTFVDADGDGYGWSQVNFEDDAKIGYGAAALMSASYINGDETTSGFAVEPDNWAISPKFSIPLKNPSMAFLAIAQDDEYAADHFAVYAGETDDIDEMICISGDESIVLSDDLYYTRYEFDLSEFAGKDAYIAIRHFDCTDEYEILIDQLEIYGEAGTYELYIDGTQVDDANKGNILGDGNYIYDSEENTLTIKADINSQTAAIENYIDGLTIIFDGDISITSLENAIEIYANTTITTKNGKTTIEADASGILVQCYNEDEEGIPIPAVLTIKDADIEITGGMSGITGSDFTEKLIIDNSDLVIEGSPTPLATVMTGAVIGFSDGIELTDCEIIEPEDAVIGTDAICVTDDEIANRVVIGATGVKDTDTDDSDTDDSDTSGEDTDGGDDSDTNGDDTDGKDTDDGGDDTDNDRPYKVYQRGDANLDDIVDIIDVVMIRAHIINQTKLTGLNLRVSECNDDENVDIIDVVMIRSHIVNGTELGTIIIYDDEL